MRINWFKAVNASVPCRNAARRTQWFPSIERLISLWSGQNDRFTSYIVTEGQTDWQRTVFIAIDRMFRLITHAETPALHTCLPTYLPHQLTFHNPPGQFKPYLNLYRTHYPLTDPFNNWNAILHILVLKCKPSHSGHSIHFDSHSLQVKSFGANELMISN